MKKVSKTPKLPEIRLSAKPIRSADEQREELAKQGASARAKATTLPTVAPQGAKAGAVATVAATPTSNYRERVETAYAEVNRRGGEFMRSVCAFGALLDEVAAFLGESRGGDRKSNFAAAKLVDKTLQSWLAENCPEVNYKTAMGYKALAGKAAKMIGGGTQAIAALQGRDTVAAPGAGEVIDVDSEIIEKREALFAEVDSRRKLEQAYFAFMAEECGGEGSRRPTRNGERRPLPKLSQRDEAKAIWNGVMLALSKSSVRDAIPLLGEKETQVCHDGLMDLLSLLKKHLKEF